ncbi:MAG: hypothetical protein BWZ10_02829 [candidate division BRC1 bacterium ADurb.BinA364]|nr:MAG: hypothetical protein BWZ10_02829 [candidate division BRC1 bacterium ADurb.BinA364]
MAGVSARQRFSLVRPCRKIDGRCSAIDRIGQATEHVLYAERNPRHLVRLDFANRDDDIGLGRRPQIVDIEIIEHVRSAGADSRGRRVDARVGVEAVLRIRFVHLLVSCGIEAHLAAVAHRFEFRLIVSQRGDDIGDCVVAVIRLHDVDPGRARLQQMAANRVGHIRMRGVREHAVQAVVETAEGDPVDFHRDLLAAGERGQPAQVAEHLAQRVVDQFALVLRAAAQSDNAADWRGGGGRDEPLRRGGGSGGGGGRFDETAAVDSIEFGFHGDSAFHLAMLACMPELNTMRGGRRKPNVLHPLPFAGGSRNVWGQVALAFFARDGDCIASRFQLRCIRATLFWRT